MRSRLLVAGAFALGVACARPADRAASVAPADPAAACASCHAAETRSWEASAHHRAASDPLYVDAVAIEPLPFCRGCHAPSADPRRPTPPAAVAQGIGCIDCHTDARAHASRPAVHASTRPCASCHEFPFPDGTPGMQRTASEHDASEHARTTCVTCHMPGKDHGFAVTDTMIRGALVADIASARPGAVALRLQPGRVGHAFPTGDLFRRVVVEADLVDEHGTVQASRRRDLARTLDHGQAHEGADERIGADLAPCFELDFAPVRDIARPSIHLTLTYERVAHPIGPRPEQALVDSRVLLLETDVADRGPARPCAR